MKSSGRANAHRTSTLRFVGLLAAGGVLAGACTVLIQNQVHECKENADCLQFTNAVCDKEQNICVSESSGASSASSSGTGTGSGSGGSGGSGGTTAGSGGGTGSSGSGGSGGGMDPCDEATTKPLYAFPDEVVTSTSLSNKNDYLMQGKVYVRDGAILTIEKCTRIYGKPTPQVMTADGGMEPDYGKATALVVQPGAQIIAVGTADEPIVFTSGSVKENPPVSPKAGDWGGVILLGEANTNHRDTNGLAVQGDMEGLPLGEGKYGGAGSTLHNSDSSGQLKYVRIEYGGAPVAQGNEINGLTFGGVGSGTTIDFVQVRHCLDDCFEFFGGTVNAKHLACQYNEDDGFDWDNGYVGSLQYLVLQHKPDGDYEMNGFEGDNYPDKSAHTPLSNPTISNATLCGKNMEVNLQQYGMLLRRSTKGRIMNTIAMGFEAGFDARDNVGTNAAPTIQIESSIFFGNLVENLSYIEVVGGMGTYADDDTGFDEQAFLNDMMRNNSAQNPVIPDCFNANAPNFSPTNTLTANAATPPAPLDSTATYIGAFRDANDKWATTGKWVKWSAQ